MVFRILSIMKFEEIKFMVVGHKDWFHHSDRTARVGESGLGVTLTTSMEQKKVLGLIFTC